MIEIKFSVHRGPDTVFENKVMLTDEKWPPQVSMWRKACQLAQLMLWEAHPTYPERKKALQDFIDKQIADDDFSPETCAKQRKLLKQTTPVPME